MNNITILNIFLILIGRLCIRYIIGITNISGKKLNRHKISKPDIKTNINQLNILLLFEIDIFAYNNINKATKGAIDASAKG